ncbi:DUF1934 domain-containing protein [Paucilactobacillus kaifaensis]|uniref:DUF1934 domain-containing protein n=1 Tax=Paucilactobacillus kaifaensis TaxID=2559921 RepID=UPI001484E711|nr:DUF1934 domain-containing protein [Paucilactobacillus kaifaensis]
MQTTIEQDGEQEQFNFDETGQLVSIKDAYYLRYQEGETKIPVTFKFDGNGDIFLTRNAANRTRFQFRPNQTFETHYQSEYGLIKLEVRTIRVLREIDFNAGHGHLIVDYQLWAQKQLIGKYQIRLQFNA